MSLPSDLDVPNLPRSHSHTNELLGVFADDELWDEYGVDSDIIVCSHTTSTMSSMLNNHILQPFTNDFPCADIHELISSDILHQLIKGTFKDHLVTWVEEYLYLVHSKKKADDIMDEID